MSFNTKSSKLTAAEKIIAAKVKLQENSPFFSYLVMSMFFKETEPGDSCKTMGINAKDEIVYDKEFVEKLKLSTLANVLCHEIGHRILNHIPRFNTILKRIPDKAEQIQHHMMLNICGDICINDMLTTSGVELPDVFIKPNKDHTVTIPSLANFTCVNVDTKPAEVIYEELKKHFKKHPEAANKLKPLMVDVVMCGEGDGEGQGEDVGELPEKWKDLIASAATVARQRGLVPAGFAKIIGSLLEPAVPWRQRLYKFIQNDIVCDFTYSRPSRRSRATGVYMPSNFKENIDIVIHTDTSGSVWDKAAEFVSQIYHIYNSFDNIEITWLVCDAEIHDVIKFNRGKKVEPEDLKPKGGGGTSHAPVVKWMLENKPHAKVLVSMTDCYSDIQECYKKLPHNMRTLIVVPKEYEGAAKNIRDSFDELIVMND